MVRNILLFNCCYCKFRVISEEHCLGKFIRCFNLVKLFFYPLAKLYIIDIVKQEIRFYNLSIFFECRIKLMLTRIRCLLSNCVTVVLRSFIVTINLRISSQLSPISFSLIFLLGVSL